MHHEIAVRRGLLCVSKNCMPKPKSLKPIIGTIQEKVLALGGPFEGNPH